MILSVLGSCVSGRCRRILSNPTPALAIESMSSRANVGNVGFWRDKRALSRMPLNDARR